MTITVKTLSAMFESVNRGKFDRIKQIDINLWECNGFHIEKMYVSKELYLVQHSTKDIWFNSFDEAVNYCLENEY